MSEEIALEKTECELCGDNQSTVAARGKDYEYWTSEQEFTVVECLRCGHLYLDPRPSIEAINRIYPSHYYTLEGRHTAHSSWLIASMKKRVLRGRTAAFRDKLEKKQAAVFDVGCGDCSFLLNVKEEHPHVKAAGVDLAFTDGIRKQCTARDIRLIEGNVEETNLPEETFDIVTLNQVIEHVWKPREVLVKLHRSLTAGGLISIQTVNTDGYDRKLFKDGLWGAYYFPRHLNFFSFETLGRLLKETGFEVVMRKSLLAPIVWAFSLHAFTGRTREKAARFPSTFFTDRSPLCLAMFSLVDALAMALGLATSNQLIIAEKK